jgi:hypothetical protein
MLLSSLELSLLEDTVQRAGCKVVGWLASHGYPPGFGRVLELAMAAARRDEVSAV